MRIQAIVFSTSRTLNSPIPQLLKIPLKKPRTEALKLGLTTNATINAMTIKPHRLSAIFNNLANSHNANNMAMNKVSGFFNKSFIVNE